MCLDICICILSICSSEIFQTLSRLTYSVCFSSPVSLKMMSLSLKVGSGSIIARLDDLRKI